MRGRVVWVVDGDTIHVQVGPRLEKVRYIGVNAPEIPHPHARGWRDGGARAREVNRRLVAGRDVRLEVLEREGIGLCRRLTGGRYRRVIRQAFAQRGIVARSRRP